MFIWRGFHMPSLALAVFECCCGLWYQVSVEVRVLSYAGEISLYFLVCDLGFGTICNRLLDDCISFRRRL
ncbi:hypothetical protein Mapa_000194 [Marchantia paleacea]|nr:hypothetical protein Mapa_000194 [Marchantia paleacea]